jgi:peptide/nickel transport system permease protein
MRLRQTTKKEDEQNAMILSVTKTRHYVREIRSSRLAFVGFLIIVSSSLLAIFAPIISPYNPISMDIQNRLTPPCVSHPFGTDEFGRDVLSRTIYGIGTSLFAAFGSISLALLFGLPAGLIAGYYGGRIDSAFMRIADVFFSFPVIVLAVALLAVLGKNVVNVVLAIGLAYIPAVMRITRGGVLKVRSLGFIDAARVSGATNLQIIKDYIFPNSLPPILVNATYLASIAIVVEASLSFLGLGTQPPDPSLGLLLSDARQYLRIGPWIAIFPGIAITILILGFNLFGDGIRDIIDPRMKK